MHRPAFRSGAGRAWIADDLARERGRVEICNAQLPNRLDGWTMDAGQYELMRQHLLGMIEEEADPDGTIPLQQVVAAAQERYATHPLFPEARVRTNCTLTEVDLEARCEIARIPGSSPQRICRWREARADQGRLRHAASRRDISCTAAPGHASLGEDRRPVPGEAACWWSSQLTTPSSSTTTR